MDLGAAGEETEAKDDVMEMVDLAIVGAGPAGLTAALYGARARARTVVFEAGLPGGQIVKTEWVENYPGFPQGISGPELGEFMVRQAERFGAEIRTFAPVDELRSHGQDLVLRLDQEEVRAHAVVVATGADPRKLGVPGEEEFTGRGVSWCATCDGALFRDKVVCVVGGGDTAVQEANFLTKFAREVHVIHRRQVLRATECIQERCFVNPKISFHWNRVVDEIAGEDGRVRGIRLTSTSGEAEEFLSADGVFIFVGVQPRNELLRGLVELDREGFALVDEDYMTTMPGLYAAGDVTAGELKQVITAAANGATAAFQALRYIDEKVCPPR
jgi:thioredoxin reductase (NADPH)